MTVVHSRRFSRMSSCPIPHGIVEAGESLMKQRSVGRGVGWIGLALVGCVLSGSEAVAQSPGSGPLTLNDAIQLALKNYPAIKESRARAQAAAEIVGVARTAFLPRLDMIGQLN